MAVNLLKSELFKIIRKKEIYIFLATLAAIAALFAYLMGQNSSIMVISGTDKMGAMFFSVFVYNFINEFFLLTLMIAATISGIWATEFNSGTMATTIAKAKNRREIFIQKTILSVLICLIFVMMLFLACWIFYSSIGQSSDYYTTDFLSLAEENLDSYFALLVTFIIFGCSLMTLLSMTENQIKSVLAFLIIFIAMKVLENFQPLKSILPSALANPGLPFTSDWDITKLVIHISILLIWSIVFYAAAYFIFKKKNIN